jgi:hypothetical protein
MSELQGLLDAWYGENSLGPPSERAFDGPVFEAIVQQVDHSPAEVSRVSKTETLVRELLHRLEQLEERLGPERANSEEN